tara:strand:+ start:25 stop:948 length:924 start_codon:yes stop_codon:yes gene_type:complete
MKKILLLIFFSFIFLNQSFSKTIDVGLNKLEVPNKFNLIDFSTFELMNESCEYFYDCYGIVDDKILEILNQINDGQNYNDIKILKPLISKYEKVINSDKNFERNFKSFFKLLKSTLNKNNSGILFSYYGTRDDKNTSVLLNKYNIDLNIDEIKGMSDLELKKFTKKIKKDISSGSDTFMIMDGMGVKFKKFSIKRNSQNRVYLILNGDIKYILGSSTIKIGKIVYYLSEIDNKLFAMDGICISNCSEFFSSFDQIVDKSFNQKIQIKNVSKSNDEDIVEKLKKLNDLYKSGVLTKEEFEKAKKKILN